MSIKNSEVYLEALKKKGISSIMHTYGDGGHGYGLGKGKGEHLKWPQELKKWITQNNIIYISA